MDDEFVVLSYDGRSDYEQWVDARYHGDVPFIRSRRDGDAELEGPRARNILCVREKGDRETWPEYGLLSDERETLHEEAQDTLKDLPGIPLQMTFRGPLSPH
ncbi:hypothetical protein H7H51_23645 [Mycolicibacterium farcinogenes]|nr:hypothetical protein [Mycolicibacterium farcinogenes]